SLPVNDYYYQISRDSFIMGVVTIVLFILQLGFIIHYFGKFFLEYINGNVKSWRPKYDRITLAFIIAFLFGHIYFLKNIEEGVTQLLASLMFLTLTILLILFTQKRKDKKNNTNKKVAEKEKQLNEETQKKFSRLLEDFKCNEIIDDDTDIKNKVFVIGQSTDITLNLTFSDFYYLHKMFKKYIYDISLKDFCKMFLKNGKIFNYESVKVEGCRQKISKNKDVIDNIFLTFLKKNLT
ncbi:MAG: hypothetical protein Q4A09_02735, partial [Capnocytophaga felis]|nr:hypothetical protein [Capnocytophaga felis]